tara:strand:- start:29360 stop:30025 length:666 start_codon:yes stop_codon:yes gene_type:complete
MSKYSRYNSIVSRNSDENVSEDHWLKQFEKTLQKGAVQSVSKDSFYDQINAIIGGTKSKYSSVADAVEDMKERSGLMAYLNKVKAAEDNIKNKIASDNQDAFDKKIPIEGNPKVLLPIVIRKCPHVENTLKNFITSTRGNSSLPAIIDKIKSIHKSDVSNVEDFDSNDFMKYVSELNLKEKTKNPSTYENNHDLGKIDDLNDSDVDPSNTDAFNSLNPAKI